nr:MULTISPECIES: peptidylprolyl isomerase [unclassified Actinoplanes]
MARRAVRERQRRRVLAGAGTALAVVLVVAAGLWIGGVFDGKGKSTTTEAQDDCIWTPFDKSKNANLKEVGTPPTKNVPQTGTEQMTVTTDLGAPLVATLDVASAPCAAASFSYLAGKQFFDGTPCHEVLDIGAVHCGDPSGTGLGGPTYSYYDENIPDRPAPSASAGAGTVAKPTVLYPKGTVATIGNPAGSNGSQFLIFFKDYAPTAAPTYSILGQVTGGLDTLAKIAKIPTVADSAGDKVTPKEKITIKSLTVAADTVAAAPSASVQS